METGFLSRRTHTIDVSLRRHYHICLKALSVFQTLQRDQASKDINGITVKPGSGKNETILRLECILCNVRKELI